MKPPKATKAHPYNPLMLALAFALGSFSEQIYMPAMPNVAATLGVSKNLVHITLTSYIVASSLTAFLVGGVIDNYKRRHTVLLALALYIVATFLCSVSSNIYELILFRFFQGACISASIITLTAVVQENREGAHASKSFALFSITVSVAHMLAPAIGGHIVDASSWHYCFLLLVVVGAAVFLLYYFRLFLLEHTIKLPQKVNIRTLASEYLQVLKNRQFIFTTLSFMLLCLGSWVLYAIAPFYFISELGFSASTYGHMVAFISFGYFLGALANHRFSAYFRVQNFIFMCFVICICGSTWLVLAAYIWPSNIVLLALPVFCFGLGAGAIGPAMKAVALGGITKRYGLAAALYSVMVRSGAAIGTVLAIFHGQDALMQVGMVLTLFVGLSSFSFMAVKVRSG